MQFRPDLTIMLHLPGEPEREGGLSDVSFMTDTRSMIRSLSPGHRLSLLCRSMLVPGFLLLGGCTKSIEVSAYDEYRNQKIEILTNDSVRYELAPGWKADSASGISGQGLSVAGDSTSAFHGMVPSSRIASVTIEDSETPAIWGGVVAVAGLVAIWVNTGRH